MRRVGIGFVAAVTAVVTGVVLLGIGVSHGFDLPGVSLAGNTSGGTPAAPSAPPSAPPTPDAATLARQEQARRAKVLTAALSEYAEKVPEFSVAVVDHRTGQTYAYRGSEKYETASVVKVQILACLLLDAQDDDRDLTRDELSLARRMIRVSDNAATSALFGRLGGRSALTRCNKRLGLTATTVSSSWGLTRTTVLDQTRLLDKLVDARGPLDAGSRAVAFTLMSTVDKGQQWGVPDAARDTETATVKNGWLSRSTEGGRWIVNTVGRITDAGQTGEKVDVSVAVLSHGHRTMGGGITVVEKVGDLARRDLAY